MNIKEIEKKLVEGGIEQNEAKIEAKMLVKHFLGYSDIDLVLKEELDSDAEALERLEQAADLRATKRLPIQHIIGTAYFMGEDFIVNKNVLIPRDETEILVRKAVELIGKMVLKNIESPQNPAVDPSNQSQTLRVLDIGTGSGCISCMVAKLTDTQVLGVDISTDALQVAIDNSAKLGLFNKAIFRKSDLFSNVDKNKNGEEKFDMIISNPPYIPPIEKENIQIEVGFEPESALYTHDELGIDFYDKITTQAPEYLNSGGYLMFELGIGQSQLVKNLMEKNGFKNVQIEKDLAGIDRIIWGEI